MFSKINTTPSHASAANRASTTRGECFASMADAVRARRLAGGLKQVIVRFAAGGAVGCANLAG